MGELRAVELDFFQNAPIRAFTSGVIAAPASAIFALMGPDPSAWTWVPGISDRGRYTSAAPPGAGATRLMFLLGRETTETVLAYEQDRRFAFRVDRAPMPGMHAFAEDYVLETTPIGTRVSWTVAADGPSPLLKGPIAVTAKFVFGRMRRRLAARAGLTS
jgi:hypothetical protein